MLQGKLSGFWSNGTVIAVLAIALASAISAVGVMLIGDGRLADVPGAIVGVVNRPHGDDAAASRAAPVAQPVRRDRTRTAVHARRQTVPAAAVTFAPQTGPAVVAAQRPLSTARTLPARPGRRPARRRAAPTRPRHRTSPAPRRTTAHRPAPRRTPSAPPAAAARPAPAPVAASTVPAAPVATTPVATTPAATTPPAAGPVTTGPPADPPPVTTPPVDTTPPPVDTTPPPVDTTPPPVDTTPPPAAGNSGPGSDPQGSGEGPGSSGGDEQ
jgi:hypothetical protein